MSGLKPAGSAVFTASTRYLWNQSMAASVAPLMCQNCGKQDRELSSSALGISEPRTHSGSL